METQTYNYLLVEDNDADINVCHDTIDRLNIEQATRYNVSITVAKDLNTAISQLKESIFDGVIIDIRLGEKDDGNEVISSIINNYRLPLAIMTGTPDTILEEGSPIRIYKKGEVSYDVIIKSLIGISQTGIFKVIGGKGIIEETMTRVFWNNLYPRINTWENLKESGSDTEAILLRYAIAHIHELLEDNIPVYSIEEVYIAPPLSDKIRTGCILKNKDDELYYIVLSPPCDLVVHNGLMKTDRVMLCEIDDHRIVSRNAVGDTKGNKRSKVLIPTIKNNNKEYYHWLPPNSVFEGGYINFRKVINFSQGELEEKFYPTTLRVQDAIVKDILSRFSSYYARQGQPDFDFVKEAESIINMLYSDE
ncbi:hypothetical protein ACP26L_31940 [Paenibacillus sp. S-38]|uniref:hypothetical protein n=1 Tax=Paenibacillus sp. S-38 TaxID=3416710 RepID=UPI003CF71863